MRFLLLLPIVWLAAFPGSQAAETKPAKPSSSVPEPPPIPENYNPPEVPELGTQDLEPEVTITTKGTEIHEEYRLNGQLYMIKITPKKGKPYYLIDYEGSGKFRRSDFEPRIAIPTWVIKSF
jgi:hypothetical protein